MAALIPLLSTTQEEALVELVEQIMDTQNLAIAAASGNTTTKIPEIVDNYRADLKAGSLTFGCTLGIFTTRDLTGKPIMGVKIVYT